MFDAAQYERDMDIDEDAANVTVEELRRKIKALKRLADDYSKVEESLGRQIDTLKAQVAELTK